MAVWIGAFSGRNDGPHDGRCNGLGLGRWGWRPRLLLLLLVRRRRVLVHDWRRRVWRAGLEGWVQMGIVRARGPLDHLRMIWRTTIGHHGVRPVGGVHHMRTRGIHGGITGLGLLSWGRRAEWADALHGGKVGDAANVNALTNEEVIEAIEGETWVVTLKEGLTLCDLEFKALSVASWSEGATMPIFLVAGGAGCCTSRAFWVFRIALKGNELMEIAVGVARRDLPLFSCSCTSHTPRATAAVGGARTALALLRRFLRLASVAFQSMLSLLLALPVVVVVVVVVAAAAVAAEGAGWDPSAGPIEETMVVPGRSAVAASNQPYRRRLHRPTRRFVCIYMSRFRLNRK